MLLYFFLDKQVQDSLNKDLAWVQTPCEWQTGDEGSGFLVLSQWLSSCSSLLNLGAQSLRKQRNSVLLTNNPFNGFPGGSMVKNLHAKQEIQVWSLGWEDPLEKEITTIPIFLPEKSHGQKSLVGYSPLSCNESDLTERLNHHHHQSISSWPR